MSRLWLGSSCVWHLSWWGGWDVGNFAAKVVGLEPENHREIVGKSWGNHGNTENSTENKIRKNDGNTVRIDDWWPCTTSLILIISCLYYDNMPFIYPHLYAPWIPYLMGTCNFLFVIVLSFQLCVRFSQIPKVGMTTRTLVLYMNQEWELSLFMDFKIYYSIIPRNFVLFIVAMWPLWSHLLVTHHSVVPFNFLMVLKYS